MSSSSSAATQVSLHTHPPDSYKFLENIMITRRFARIALGLALALGGPSLAVGCSSDDGPAEQSENITQASDFTTNFDAYNAIYNTNFETLEQAYSINITVGETVIPAPTHLFGEAVNVIPYSNNDGDVAADGTVFERGDSEIAKVFKTGEVGIAVKHHRSEYPTLDLNNADPGSMKEHFKLQDTHIEIVVGVERDGQPGAITVNNPQSYEDGMFGNEQYAMIFLKPVYPSYLSADQKGAFEANIRTMLLGFGAVTEFPGDYNGGDPLGARNTERVREHVKNMVLAMNGDAAAIAYFADDLNQVYCAELAFVAFSAGLEVPLNDATMIPMVGEEAWNNFKGFIAAHNAGEASPFTALNSNDRVKYVQDLTTAPADLQSAGSYGGQDGLLAFQPMTMSDIVEQFMRTHIPREILGEELAPAQGAILAKMKPGLLEQMGMDQLPEDDPNRAAVSALYDQIVAAVSVPHENYEAFRASLEPLLLQARQITGPRGDTGEGLFVPPSLYHITAQGKHNGGLMGLQYEGHGVHVTAVEKIGGGAAAPEPTPTEEISSAVTCEGACGGQAEGGCWCDSVCADQPNGGDCCDDKAALCDG